MSYNAELQANNADLQAILDAVNNLPEGGAAAPTYGEIAVSTNATSITIPAIIGKSNVVVMYLGEVAVNGNATACVTHVMIQGSARFHSVTF